MRMCCVMSSVACLAHHIFPHNNWHDFREKKLLNIKCVFWFSLQHSSETFLFLRISEWDMIRNVCWSLCKGPVIFVRFSWNMNFQDISQKILKCQVLWKSVQWGAELFHADRQDMRKLIFAFRNFANTPKNELVIECWQNCDFTGSCHHSVSCEDVKTWFALCISAKSYQIQQYLKFTVIMCKVHSHPTHYSIICAIFRDELKNLWWLQTPSHTHTHTHTLLHAWTLHFVTSIRKSSWCTWMYSKSSMKYLWPWCITWTLSIMLGFSNPTFFKLAMFLSSHVVGGELCT